MKRLILVLLFLTNLSFAAQAQSVNELTEDEFKQWTAFIDSLAEKQQFSGIVFLADNGQVKFQRAYGLARRKPDVPNRLDTRVNIASMGKMFTAVIILQLAEQGKFSLDDTVAKVAPGLMRKEAAEKVKIKHLLNHTSGIEDQSSCGDWRNELFPLEVIRPAKEPATEYYYNDLNFTILGAIIERVTGEDYFRYVQKQIFNRLKMNSTENYQGKLLPRSAIGYYSVEENGKLRFGTRFRPLTSRPSGGQYSTVQDLNIFLRALITNKLLKPEMTRLMLTPKPELNNTRYGYGIQYFLDGKLVGHSGGEDVYPQDAWALTYPPTSYSLIVLSNLRTNLGDDSTARPIVTKLLNFIEK